MGDRDLRKYAQQTNIRLIAGALLVLFVIGDGLIYVIYGAGAAITGLLCLAGGLLPIVLIFLFFILLDWVVKRANRE
jgi:glucose-6-phosphate-specific signal transduction histidine kinase